MKRYNDLLNRYNDSETVITVQKPFFPGGFFLTH
jgi:hypothetical protein